MANSTFRYNLDLVFSNLLYGVNFSYFVSLVTKWVPFENLFFMQIAASALFFIPFAIFSRRYRLDRRDFGRIFIVTLLIVYGSMYTLLWGATYTTPISVAVISTLGPVFTLIAARMASGQGIHSAIRIVGIVLAFGGAALLLVDQHGVLVHGTPAWGNALILVSVFCVAINTVIIKPVLEKHGTLVVMGWYYIIGLLITAPFFMRQTFATEYTSIPLGAQLEMLYILIFGTMLPAYLLYRGTEKLTSDHTALYRYIQPAMTTVVATIRGQEQIDKMLIIASVLIFAGIVLSIVAHKQLARLVGESPPTLKQ